MNAAFFVILGRLLQSYNTSFQNTPRRLLQTMIHGNTCKEVLGGDVVGNIYSSYNIVGSIVVMESIFTSSYIISEL